MPSLRPVLSKLSAILLLAFASALPSRAQSGQLSGANSTPVSGEGHHYLGTDAETVNPADGSVSIRIKVPVPPGRKLTLPLELAFDSKGSPLPWGTTTAGTAITPWYYTIPALSRQARQYTATTKLSDGSTQCLAYTGYLFYGPNGTPHSLGLSNIIDYWVYYDGLNQETIACKQSSFWQVTSSSGDDGNGGPYAATLLNAVQGNYENSSFYPGENGSPEIAVPDGTVYKFQSTSSSDWGCNPNTTDNVGLIQSNSGLVSLIEDRNGNQISITATCGSGNQPLTTGCGESLTGGCLSTPFSITGFTATDTAGRTVMSASNFGTNGSTLTVSGLSQPYTQTWSSETTTTGPTMTTTSITSVNNGDPNCLGTGSGASAGGQKFTAMTALKLPNGQSYGFEYDDSYDEPNQVTYASGGYVKYEWGINAQSQLFSYADPQVKGAGFTCMYIADAKAIAHRYVSFDGQTTALQQDFSYSTTWDTTYPWQWDTKTTTVTTHDMVRGTSFQTVYVYTPVSGDSNGLAGQVAQIPVENQIQYYDTTGTLLETLTKHFFGQYEMFCELTQLGSSGPISGAFFAYGPGDQITDKREFTFGQLSSPTVCQNYTGMPTTTPARETVTNYQSFGPTPVFPNTSIFDKPCQIIVNGNGTRVAETDEWYDGSPTSTVCGSDTPVAPATANSPIQHDTAYAYNASTQPQRGNTTSVSKLCLQASPACPAANVTTNYSFDETGQAISTSDPNGNVTQYAFGDNYSTGTPPGQTNAYLTKVTYPTTNGVQHIVSHTYNYANGQRASGIDENNQVTNYKYNTPPSGCSYTDGFGRISEVDLPDGGKTTFCYNDAPVSSSSPAVTTTKALNSSQSVVSEAISDGMGHVTSTELTSDPQGTVLSKTVYDGLGHTYQAYNPYRSTSDPTYGYTTYVYDALGRTTQVTKPDNSIETTQYCNTPPSSALTSSVLVTDEAGHWRRSQSDGLGRLVEVDEPNSTTATVNVCPGTGEPIWVTNYTYDTLNDLIGVVQGGSRNRSFTFNSLKQLLQSTNPESGTICYGNLSGSTCQQNGYDANGNLIYKSDARKITTTYSYDALNRVTGTTYSNSDPSLAFTYDQSACLGQPACYNIGHRTTMTDAAGTENLSYDKMGRELTEQRSTNSITKTTLYTYDLAGDLLTLTYPSGRTITYTYDLAGRASEAQDIANGINYALGTCANGSSSSGVCYGAFGSVEQIQNGTNLISTYLYNTRLQPCWIYATTGTALATNTSCTATDSTPGNILDLQYNFNPGHDNGNVIGITNNRDTTRTQSFTYDQVNRIATAGTSSTTGGNCWGESYTLDQWANLTTIGAMSGYTGCTQESLSVTATANNQLSATGFSYDPSGNMRGDGANTYNWNAEAELTISAGVSYEYDGDGNRVIKSNGTVYWYGAGSEILDESNGSGSFTNEYVFFSGKRIAMRNISSGTIYYYAEDMLGSTRTMVQAGQTTLCYDSDFYPYGGERTPLVNNCSQHYKFEGKERDAETGNDDFGARYYTSRLGRWLTADWSAVPAPVPYANLINPQTLNLYAMVSDNPESFADLDGHTGTASISNINNDCGGHPCPPPPDDGLSAIDLEQDMYQQEVTEDEIDIEVAEYNQLQRQLAAQQAQDNNQQHQPSSNPAPSKDFASVSFWPSGAGHLGHIGIGVDTDDTSGFATRTHHFFLGFLLGLFFPGRVQNDISTHTNPTTGEVAPHLNLHIPISAAQATAMHQAIDDRTSHPGLYNLYFRNCGDFVERVLHAGGVGGVPHSEIFFPPALFGMLWYANTWR